MSKIGTIVGIIFGTVVGGGVTYWYLNTKYSKVIDIETQDYIDQIDALKNQVHNLQKKVVGKLEDEKEAMINRPSNYSEAVVVDNSINVNDIDEDDDDEPDIEPDDVSDNIIRYISKGDYDDDEDYEKEEMKYFSGDNVITQDGEILDEDEFVNVCGRKALHDLINSKNNVGEIFVRNEEYVTDYKIKRINLSYQKYINSRN